MARLDYIDSYQKTLWIHLLDNLPTGYTDITKQVINTDLDKTKAMTPPYLQQSTVEVGRVNSSAGGGTSRTRFIHTISVYVDKDERAQKEAMQTTVRELVSAFENTIVNGLYLFEASPEKVGDEPNTNLYRYDINVNGYFEGN